MSDQNQFLLYTAPDGAVRVIDVAEARSKPSINSET